MQAFIESNFAWLWIVTNKQKKSIRWRTLFCTGKLPTGLEPVIYWLRINRSTNWATEALWTVLYYDTRGRGFCQEKNESSRGMLRKPFGVMISLPDQFRYSSLDTHSQNRRFLLCSFLLYIILKDLLQVSGSWNPFTFELSRDIGLSMNCNFL